MVTIIKKIVNFLSQVFKEFNRDNCASLAAGLAYYTVFFLPALLVLIMLIGGIFISQHNMQNLIGEKIRNSLGKQAALAIQAIIKNATMPNQSNFTTVFASIVTILFSAAGAFMSLQTAFNIAWKIMINPKIKKTIIIKKIFIKRALSFAFILVIILLLVTSLMVSAVILVLDKYFKQILPHLMSSQLLIIINILIDFIVTIISFSFMFKFLPDAKTYWKDAWLGGIFTAILFIIGKSIFAIYIVNIHPGSVFGAASSFVTILLFTYYTSLILLLGAEFTQVLTKYRGNSIQPVDGAVKYKKEFIKE